MTQDTNLKKNRRKAVLKELEKFEQKHPEIVGKLSQVAINLGSTSQRGKRLTAPEHFIKSATTDVFNNLNTTSLEETLNDWIRTIEKRELATIQKTGWALLDDFKLTLLDIAKKFDVTIAKSQPNQR